VGPPHQTIARWCGMPANQSNKLKQRCALPSIIYLLLTSDIKIVASFFWDTYPVLPFLPRLSLSWHKTSAH
jgi:hypothetical protein